MTPKELQVLEDVERTYRKIRRARRKLLEAEQELETAFSELVAVTKNEGTPASRKEKTDRRANAKEPIKLVHSSWPEDIRSCIKDGPPKGP